MPTRTYITSTLSNSSVLSNEVSSNYYTGSNASGTYPRLVFVDIGPVLVKLGNVGMFEFYQIIKHLLQLFLSTIHAQWLNIINNVFYNFFNFWMTTLASNM